MPSRLITVTLNSNHSRQFAALIPSDEDINPTVALILKHARNKFKMKALSKIYILGGSDLSHEESLKPLTREVWVSKGEPYCGPPAPSPPSHQGEVRLTHQKSYGDPQAVTQLQSLATLSGVHLVAGMPDLHPGNRFPVGCAVISDGVYPALVGSDIGCGIALYHLDVPSRTLPTPEKLASKLRGLDAPWSGDVKAWLASYGILKASPFDSESLGTVGAGNHFAEICQVEDVTDPAVGEELGLANGSVCLLVHTGSREIGASIFASETNTLSNPYLAPDDSHLREYIAEHDYAVAWATANRDLVAHRIRACLFGDTGDLHNQGQYLRKVVEVTHNSVTKKSVVLGDEEKEVWIHRKGAAPSDRGIVPCAGSRGAFSWLIQPTEGGMDHAFSLPHGAGRRHSRTALRSISLTKSDKISLITTSLGSHVVCTDPDLLLEERPEAYKSIEDVMDDVQTKGMGRGVVCLRPLVSYKIREAGERNR